MCLVSHEQLAPGIRLGSVDVILSDVHFWGGFRANQKMIAVCEAFGLAVGCTAIASSAFHRGDGHLAAASPQPATRSTRTTPTKYET